MATISKAKTNAFKMLAGLLLILAPVLAVKTSCLFMFGEPECPDVFK